ncbi:MAG: ankyrin repeat domain-containing protein [Treponema sp.]|nr:ankyrin repeat domain-containing protein [Treponema sp.]
MTDDFTKELAGIKSDSLIYIYDSIFKDFIYKEREMEPFYQQVKEMVPAESSFFIPWFKAFSNLGLGKKSEAKKFYLEALENVKFASDYLPQFVQQAFALFMYEGDKEKALKFWDAGVAKGIFAHTTKRFFDSFDAKEQFWVQFAPKMFADSEGSQAQVISDYKKTSEDGLTASIDDCDFKKFKKYSASIDFNSYLCNGVSPLYYAIGRKGTLAGGEEKFIEDLVNVRAGQLISQLDLSSMPEDFRSQQYFNIIHQMRVTFEKSGLGHLMFVANCGQKESLPSKISEIEKIIELAVEKTDDMDAFVKQIEGKMGTNALHLAAENDDLFSCRKLLEKGADPLKVIGQASFGMKYTDGKALSTSVPNSFVYRLISFKAWNTLKVYLTDFKNLLKSSMTEKNSRCNITPLVYLILTTLYSSKSEGEYAKNKEIVDSFIPLFLDAGSSLDEKTAFGPAKELLGMK